jgi:hypothetical protein
VNGEVGPAIENRSLHFTSENADPTHRGEGLQLFSIALSRNTNKLDGSTGIGGSKPVGDMPRLPQRQLTGAGGDSQR